MTRPEFEREMARLREAIAALPPGEREPLERLAEETLERHEAISRAALQGHRAAERLELAFERLHAACERLAALAEQAREALTRPGGIRPPEPGLN